MRQGGEGLRPDRPLCAGGVAESLDLVSEKIRVTVTMEYVPEPESYEYPEGVEELSVEEMARQDATIWHEGAIGIQDVLEWGEVIEVNFVAYSEDGRGRDR